MNKRVLLVIDSIGTGGAEKILLNFHDYLLQEGYVVFVFVLYGNSKRFACGIESNSSNLFVKLFQQVHLWMKLIFVVRKNNPDCIFSFLERSNVIVQLLPVRNVRKIITVHNLLSIQYGKIKNAFLKHSILKFIGYSYNRGKNTSIIVVSSQIKDDLVRKMNVMEDRIFIVNNSVDCSLVVDNSREMITELLIEDKCTYLLNIGRFTVQKAQWKLIKAISILVDDGCSDVRLLLIGEGELKADLEALIINLHLAKFVFVLPFTSNPYKFMKVSDLLVLPSLYEGFPIVLSEAAALQLPFVGSEKAIPKEMFFNEGEWKDYVYANTSLDIDFSSNLNQDDLRLADLIREILSQKCFKEDLVKKTSKWSQENRKEIQFSNYVKIINGRL